MEYSEFLATKGVRAVSCGFDVGDISESLFPFQRDIVRWALRRGRAAIFADTGLGKTAMQIEWARRVAEKSIGDVLILAPLAVAQQTVREATKFDVEIRYCREQSNVKPGITITNYDMLHAFDPGAFAGVVLDESSILKSFNGKTRTAIIGAFSDTPYRLACTATPAPNDFTELGNHAEFLGIMSRVEMLSMFFVHDGGSTQDWRLKGHAEESFWRWVCSWACVVRRPSDLGYDDGAFDLPPLTIIPHVVSVGDDVAINAGMLFPKLAGTLLEQRSTRRDTIDKRVAECAAAVNAEPDESWIVWCELNTEGDALAAAIPGAVQVAGADMREDKERSMLDFAEGRIRVLVSKPSLCGFGMNFQRAARMAFVGVTHSYEQTYQAIRRSWRFGQKREVVVHMVSAETEGRIVENLKRKEAAAAEMQESMVTMTRQVVRDNIAAAGRDMVAYQPMEKMEIPEWLQSEEA